VLVGCPVLKTVLLIPKSYLPQQTQEKTEGTGRPKFTRNATFKTAVAIDWNGSLHAGVGSVGAKSAERCQRQCRWSGCADLSHVWKAMAECCMDRPRSDTDLELQSDFVWLLRWRSCSATGICAKLFCNVVSRYFSPHKFPLFTVVTVVERRDSSRRLHDSDDDDDDDDNEVILQAVVFTWLSGTQGCRWILYSVLQKLGLWPL